MELFKLMREIVKGMVWLFWFIVGFVKFMAFSGPILFCFLMDIYFGYFETDQFICLDFTTTMVFQK